MENEREEMKRVGAVSCPVEECSVTEVKKAVENLKNGKAAGPTEITADHLKYLDTEGIRSVAALLNTIMEEEKIPSAWTKSNLVTIYKEKGDPMQCKNYRGIKLLEVGLKVLEKVLDKRLRESVKIAGAQSGFQPEKGTIDAIFILRQLHEKVLEKREKLFLAFLGLEKAYDRVPGEVVYWCMRKKRNSREISQTS